MKEQIRHRKNEQDAARAEHPEEEESRLEGFGALRLLAAQLLLFTGIGSTLEAINREGRNDEDTESAPGVRSAAWAPTILGPLAAVAHLRHVADPTPASASAARLLDSAAVGAGIVGVLHGLLATRRTGGLPSLAPLALASAGILGIMLERRERENEAERRRLERRASIVERLVPKRRGKLDHIVVHV